MGIRLNRLLVAGAMLAVVLVPVGPNRGLAADSPSQFVAGFLDGAFALFRAREMSVDARRAALRDLLRAKMDIPRMAQFMTMGRLDEAPPGGRQRFQDLLVGYLVDIFYAKMAEGATGSYDVGAPDVSPPPDALAIDSIIKTSGSPPELLTWHVQPAGDSYKIVDLISEGVSFAVLHRDVFAAVMQDGGLPRLEELLAARQ